MYANQAMLQLLITCQILAYHHYQWCTYTVPQDTHSPLYTGLLPSHSTLYRSPTFTFVRGAHLSVTLRTHTHEHAHEIFTGISAIVGRSETFIHVWQRHHAALGG